MLNKFCSMISAQVLFVLLFVPTITNSEEVIPAGELIASNVSARPEGETLTRTLEMELINKRGQKRTRQTRSIRKYYGKERRSVMFFLQPKNIKGSSFLTWDYPDSDRDDDQWIYLPAARKVRRISASKRGDYFMGTDFTYDDMKTEGKPSMGDYTFKTLGTSEVDGHFCYKLESVPVNRKIAKEIGYSRVVQCVDPESWMSRKFQMWDIRGNELKTIYFRDIKQIDGIWTAHRLEAENHKTGHRSIFHFSDIKYNKPIDDKLFKKESLKRGLQ